MGERRANGVEYFPMIRDLPSDERPRERVMAVGERAASTGELLAITLRTGTGGESAIRVAERLLSRFRDLAGLAQATLEELQEVNGVGPAKAVQIKAALELGRRLTAVNPQEKPRITTPGDAANLLMSEMALLDQEHLRVILLDTRNQVLDIPTIYIGSLNTSVVRIAELFRPAIRRNAAAIIVVHNHPSGDPSPSAEDIRVTREIQKAGRLLSIELLDHVVIGHQRFVSLKERGLGFD
jgi:DNA repair protein RadC